MLGSASLVLLSMMLGATGTYAVVHHDPAPLRELHVQKASILLEKALVRLEQRQENLDELTPLIEREFVNSIEADRYRQKLVEAEAEVLRRELDLKETRLTGRAPVDDLSGPLVGDEDFIKQRLELRFEAVAEVAVIGVPDPQWGELVCAVVVPRGAAPALTDLQAHCEGRLAGFKKPRRVVAVDALPRTAATGQVQRTLLVEQVLAG